MIVIHFSVTMPELIAYIVSTVWVWLPGPPQELGLFVQTQRVVGRVVLPEGFEVAEVLGVGFGLLPSPFSEVVCCKTSVGFPKIEVGIYSSDRPAIRYAW